MWRTRSDRGWQKLGLRSRMNYCHCQRGTIDINLSLTSYLGLPLLLSEVGECGVVNDINDKS